MYPIQIYLSFKKTFRVGLIGLASFILKNDKTNYSNISLTYRLLRDLNKHGTQPDTLIYVELIEFLPSKTN